MSNKDVRPVAKASIVGVTHFPGDPPIEEVQKERSMGGYDILHKARIVQVIPAEGYLAVYFERDWEERKQDSAAWTQPLACWALVEYVDENGDGREVVGMVVEPGMASLTFPATSVNFAGYVRTGTDAKELHEMALDAIKSENELKAYKVELAKKKTETGAK